MIKARLECNTNKFKSIDRMNEIRLCTHPNIHAWKNSIVIQI